MTPGRHLPNQRGAAADSSSRRSARLRPSFSCQSAIEDAVERVIVNALNFGGVVTVSIGLGCSF
jgi:hypothetical protein